MYYTFTFSDGTMEFIKTSVNISTFSLACDFCGREDVIKFTCS